MLWEKLPIKQTFPNSYNKARDPRIKERSCGVEVNIQAEFACNDKETIDSQEEEEYS